MPLVDHAVPLLVPLITATHRPALGPKTTLVQAEAGVPNAPCDCHVTPFVDVELAPVEVIAKNLRPSHPTDTHVPAAILEELCALYGGAGNETRGSIE